MPSNHKEEHMLKVRRTLAIAGVTALSVVGVAACSSSGSTPNKDDGSMMHTTTTSGGSMMQDKGK